jgi:SAM-dependent methyltransferase
VSKEQQTIASFDYQWKNLPSGDFLISDKKWRNSVEKYILDELQMTKEQLKGKFILDAGCGQGRWSYGFAKLGCKVYGFDTSRNAVKFASERVKGKFWDADVIHWASICHGIIERDFFFKGEREPFDVIWSWGVLHHTRDPEKGFDNLVQLLKKGGTIHLYLYGKKSIIKRLWQCIYNHKPLNERVKLANAQAKLSRMVERVPVGILRYILHRVIPFSASPHSNFDAYSPSIASNHTEPEIRNWFEKRGLSFKRYTPKRAEKSKDLYVSGVKE